MCSERKPPQFSQVVWDLFRIQLSNWRWSWPQMVLTGMLAPTVSLAALGVFAKGTGANAASYVLAGSVTMALLFETQNKVAANFAFMKSTGAFDFYASLPVRLEALIVATIAAFTLLALPALVLTSILGVLLLHVRIKVSLLVVPAAVISILPFAGLGAWIGSRSRAMEEASSLSLAATLAMVAVGPVTIPRELLPEFLIWLGYLNPATYASSLLRQTLIGPISSQALVDFGVLSVLAMVAWLLTQRRINWRAHSSSQLKSSRTSGGQECSGGQCDGREI